MTNRRRNHPCSTPFKKPRRITGNFLFSEQRRPRAAR